MPIYEYRCDNGHTFETVQRMIDDPVTECEVCEASVQRVFHPVAVHFKGSGFYTTDYGKKKTVPAGERKDSDSSSDSKGSSSTDSKPSESKSSESKSSTSSSTSD